MLARLIRSIFPGACLLCDLDLPAGQDIDLCADCHPALPWNTNACPRCALPLPGHHTGVCLACMLRPPPYAAALAPLRYTGPVADWVRQLKDQMGLVEGRTLGLLLADAAAGFYRDRPPPDLLLPVPLGWRRLAARGHNQAITLALPVARRLGKPLLRLAVRRNRQTRAQRGLGHAQRLHNLAGAFATHRQWRGERVGLIDDVMTTGATAAELSALLLEAGAGEVHVLCAARTPRRQTGTGTGQQDNARGGGTLSRRSGTGHPVTEPY